MSLNILNTCQHNTKMQQIKQMKKQIHIFSFIPIASFVWRICVNELSNYFIKLLDICAQSLTKHYKNITTMYSYAESNNYKQNLELKLPTKTPL